VHHVGFNILMKINTCSSICELIFLHTSYRIGEFTFLICNEYTKNVILHIFHAIVLHTQVYSQLMAHSVSNAPIFSNHGPDSSVSIPTDYGLDGPGIESRWGKIFRTHPDRPWGPPSLLYNGYWVFPGGKAAGAWC
jgi:hypothetical protein